MRGAIHRIGEELHRVEGGEVLTHPLQDTVAVDDEKWSSRWAELPEITRPRVAHVLHSDSSGGGPVSVSRMLKYFHKTQDQVMLAGGHGRIYATCQELGIPFYEIPLETKRKALLLGFWKLVWQLRRVRPDVLVVHGQWAGPLGAMAGRLAQVPKIIYVARWPSFYTSWDLFRVVRNHLSERVPCRLADWTVTLCESSRYQYFIRRHVDEDRLLTIPNSISVEDRPTAEQVANFRKQWNWRDEHCNVVSVGRLSDQKRVMWLVRAWPEVIRRCPQARLWIVGDGGRRAFLQNLARELEIEASCVFTGELPMGMVAIASSDVVAMTSVYEGMSNIVMESFLCGKPIVASDVDGIRDTIERDVDGFLVRPGDIQSFADRLIQLIEDPTLRRKMGVAGRKSIQRYDVPLVMREYEKLFGAALAKA